MASEVKAKDSPDLDRPLILRGDGNVYCDPPLTGGGADYVACLAEMERNEA